MTKPSKLHQAALDLAEAGCYVFPLQPNTKYPVPGSHGHLEATRDVAQINAWWAIADYNIGIATEPSNLFVVDLDQKNGKQGIANWAKWCADHNVTTETYTTQTPTCGQHLYYRGSGPSSANKLADGVDTRGKGGYVVAVPSIIDDIEYRDLNQADPVAVPSIVVDALTKNAKEPITEGATPERDLPANIASARAYLLDRVKQGDVAISGQGGNQRTYELACAVREKGLSQAVARALIGELWNPACQPPWSEPELDDIVDHAFNYAQNAEAAKAFPPGAEVFAGIDLTGPVKANPGDGSFIYIRDRKTQLLAPVAEMQVDTILPARKLVLPWGATDAGKTYWSLEVVTAIAMDRPAFGQFKVRIPGPVVIFAGEDPDFLEQSRLSAIERSFGLELGGLQGLVYTVDFAMPLADGNLFEKICDELRRLEKKIGDRGIAAIMNDTLKRSLGQLNPNDGEVGQHFTDVMEKVIAEFKCAMICTAHHPKSGPEKGIAGAGGFIDNAPVTPYLSRTSIDPFEIKCEFEPKYRIGPKPKPFTVRGNRVILPKPVAGFITDLVFTVAPNTNQTATTHIDRADLSDKLTKLAAAIDTAKAHSLPLGLDRAKMIDTLAGDPKIYKSEASYEAERNAIATWLDNGTREKKTKKGAKIKAPFAGFFERDNRFKTNGPIKFWLPPPAERERLTPDARIISPDADDPPSPETIH